MIIDKRKRAHLILQRGIYAKLRTVHGCRIANTANKLYQYFLSAISNVQQFVENLFHALVIFALMSVDKKTIR